MKALLISCFGYYEFRLRYVETILQKRGINVQLVFSDFDHIEKKKTSYINPNLFLISVPKYKKNISMRRVLSHKLFSKKLGAILNQQKPDIIYALIPPNSICKQVCKYKKKHKECRVIFDVYDLWPESFPLNNTKIFLSFWKKIRDDNLKIADLILTECNYYKNYLQKFNLGKKIETVYLGKVPLREKINYNYRDEIINLCYLGSINHIIDLEIMVNLLDVINKKKKICLYIIGDGEKRELLLKKLSQKDVKYTFCGKLYDEKKINYIFSLCQYGINIYSSNTSIGLTMKSIDYFRAGLPIITMNIKDTDELVKKYKCGFSIDEKDILKVADDIVVTEYKQWKEMHFNTMKLFEIEFSSNAVNKSFQEIFEKQNICC